MREILFRGKRIDNGEWVYWNCYGDFCRESGKRTKVIIKRASGESYYYHPFQITSMIRSETIGQYTGLKDKNGKRIFEGDVIKYAFHIDYDCYIESLECPEDYEGCDYSDIFRVAKVVYCIEWGYPAFDLSDHELDCNALSELSESMMYHYEVIGNIHDNPELLEGEK